MSTTEVGGDDGTEIGSVRIGEMKVEGVVIPVADADRSTRFHANLGWSLDADAGNAVRAIEFTPPGFRCSIMFGRRTPVVGDAEVIATGDPAR